MSTVETGKWGESLLDAHLQAHGYQILQQNCRFGRHELDRLYGRVLKNDRRQIVLVEVKTRACRDRRAALHLLEELGPWRMLRRRQHVFLRRAAEAAACARPGDDVHFRLCVVGIGTHCGSIPFPPPEAGIVRARMAEDCWLWSLDPWL